MLQVNPNSTIMNALYQGLLFRYIEQWLGRPILWLACRRHVAELHLKAGVLYFMGKTTDPGVALFRRLRDEWRSLDINLDNLVLWDWDSAPEDLQMLAKDVLEWGQSHLEQGTFPRDDYRELLQLIVITLGGTVEGFSFRFPQADSNARWMAKAIYNLKLRLLSNIFMMTPEENSFVRLISEFVCCVYAKYWFTTPLPTSAPREDLDFINNLQVYRRIDVKFFWEVIRSVYSHLWYLCPQLITLSLFDKDLEAPSKEDMAKVLHQTPRCAISTGKPTFPTIAPGARFRLADFIGPESWLLFDLCELEGPQDWLLAPSSNWHLSTSFRQIEEFAKKLTVVNDLAERGCHLATEFINRVESEEQRQALYQTVLDFRAKVPNDNKESLKLC